MVGLPKLQHGKDEQRQEKKQIPFGDDNPRGKDKGNGKGRQERKTNPMPQRRDIGMGTRDENKKQIPFGDDNQKRDGKDEVQPDVISVEG
jgi:hypothetical protein